MSNSGSAVGEGNVVSSGSERQTRTGEMGVTQIKGRRYEQAIAQSGTRLFHAESGVAGLGILAIGTSPKFALYNPVGTGVNVSILEVAVWPVSGTFVAGGITHAVNTNLSAAATTGTAVSAIPALAGSGATAKCTPLKTCLLPASPTRARTFLAKNALATTSVPIFQAIDYVEGAIVLMPGATWSMVSDGGDTSPLWAISVLWEEVPI